ncbi:MAG: hypothetical protein JRF63_08265 [Deltaproteobacteria bacterium]|nr:hypothetical protein [Deltaproteobacteria bacterium]
MPEDKSDSRQAPKDNHEESSGGVTASTVVTRVTNKDEDTREHPLMSFTAVTSHQSMAEAFVRELIAVGQRMMPDHDLSVPDLATICHVALDKGEAGITMLEGRHLRGRVGEQISRANRYDETFSLIALKFSERPDPAAYDSVVDTLCERMRKSDLMFMFKTRLILVLPHTPKEPCQMLQGRIGGLLEAAFTPPPTVDMAGMTYPDPEIEKGNEVLDWCEDQIRT